ncbi:(2Fe-2S)-binding protein [Anaeroselena agilis]|uniref:2Fe-2S iron-sulfur cluster-binding protein n=1 Tax=Anaeroselena agilis TaxID=3063788 RepID=A0ABU3P0F2_9FIRM|nr:2Fe-2S iron-sulfur cluster-binding protein [Selenomonadales bacterium 4137-cl]
MRIEVTINGHKTALEVAPDEILADTLRAAGFASVRRGCDTTNCGLCTVWVDGRPTLSCAILAARMDGRDITTIEGVAGEAEAFARLLVAEGAEQCGFCSPGFIMTVLAMKRELADPTDDEIIHYLTGNLCRCTGYMGQLRAVKKFLEVRP